MNNDELKTEMVELTKFLEGTDQKYILEKENSRMEAFVNYVTGFEIEITSWEGKFKLSQDKNKKDQAAAKDTLTTNYTKATPSYLDLIYANHIKKARAYSAHYQNLNRHNYHYSLVTTPNS
ncbi:transcriptional regulator [Leeuwenhoekiella marinoflava DSM 3653]|uniref:Uncharacterized protein n=2 Tax=Leeuwenhoekiella marinoflava TaxID=988 RepID=A0A4Q0PLG7_9FLAO|nr:hypothetical protein [Leeuwenhoekiella marinoflava]RXG27910.1 hypothetical protein DSL99_2701 [Leeuwenhoekiella marinoflava]SHF61637.1 transcriptional regulator [Leeuwenhoekiella marinoflava DSM 3653]